MGDLGFLLARPLVLAEVAWPPAVGDHVSAGEGNVPCGSRSRSPPMSCLASLFALSPRTRLDAEAIFFPKRSTSPQGANTLFSCGEGRPCEASYAPFSLRRLVITSRDLRMRLLMGVNTVQHAHNTVDATIMAARTA